MHSDFSKQALLRFLDTVTAKGLMNANTAGGMKAACLKILDDVADAEDVRPIDVNTAVIRYNNRNPGILSPNSLAEYQRRVSRAIQDFVRWTENPAAFRPRGRSAAAKNKNGKEVEANPVEPEAHTPLASPPHVASPPASSAGLPLSYPLRPDFLAQVVIPRDLTAEEARRMGAFLLTLAADFRPGVSGETK
jgi:hypothetical protein